jgi:hypothetical protein
LHGTIICNKTDYKHEVLSANGTEYKDYWKHGLAGGDFV